jgi:hydrogenase maturation protease
MSAESFSAPAPTRVLVACIGNIFLGDDGFGVEVARRLAGRQYPDGVEVVDFGIRGVELAYTLLDGCETLVLVDAVSRGGPPGTLYLIEPELPENGASQVAEPTGVAIDAHSMDPVKVLAFARTLGARPGRVLLVGCEPERLAGDGDDLHLRMGLSDLVLAAVDEAVTMVESVIERCTIAGNEET